MYHHVNHILDTILMVIGIVGSLGTVWYIIHHAVNQETEPTPEREVDWQWPDRDAS